MGLFGDIADFAGDVLSPVRGVAGNSWTQITRPRIEFRDPREGFGVRFRVASTEEARRKYTDPLGIVMRGSSALGLPGRYGQEYTARTAERLGAGEDTVGAIRGKYASIIAEEAPFVLFGGLTGIGKTALTRSTTAGAVGARRALIGQGVGRLGGAYVGQEVGGDTGQTIGEIGGSIIGGLYGPKPNLGARLTDEEFGGLRTEMTALEHAIEGRKGLGEDFGELSSRLQRLRSMVDDEAVRRGDYSSRMANGDFELSPVHIGKAFDDIISRRVPTGKGANLPGILRGPLSLWNRSATVQALSEDAVSTNFHLRTEEAMNVLDMVSNWLSQREIRSGFYKPKAESLGQRIRGKAPAIFDDDIIDGLGKSRSGLAPTRENFMRHWKDWEGIADESLIEIPRAYENIQSGLRKWGEDALRNAGYSEDDVAKIIRTKPLKESESYWHRVGIDREGEPVAFGPARGVGARQPIFEPALPPDIPRTMRFSGSAALSLQDYGVQVYRTVFDRTVVIPQLKKLAKARGVTFDSLRNVPEDFRAAVTKYKGQDEWLSKATKLADDAARGANPSSIPRRAHQLAMADAPEEWRRAILQLTDPLYEGVARKGDLPERALAAVRGGRSTEELLKQAERLSATAEQQIGRQARFGALKGAGRSLRDELKGYRAVNKIDLLESQDVLKAANRTIRRSGGYTMADAKHFPGLQGMYFDKEWAKTLTQSWEHFDAPEGLLKTLNNINANLVAFQAGSADFGQILLHGATLIRPGTAHMAPVLFWRSLTEDGISRHFEKLATETTKSGDTYLDVMGRAGLRGASEPLQPLLALEKPGGATKAIGEAIQNWPTNKLFARYVSMARSQIAKNQIDMLENIKGGALTPQQYSQIADVANTLTGDFNWTKAGIGGTQRSLERTALRFAPTWLRANMNMVLTAASPSFGIEPFLMRKMMGESAATLAGLYSIAAIATGQEPNLDPTSKDFLNMRVGGVKVGPGGPIRAFMKTFARIGDLSIKAAEGDKEAAKQLFELKHDGGPLRDFWRSGAPALTGVMYDTIVEGRQSFSDRPVNLSTPEGAKSTLLGFGERLLPFTAQDALEAGSFQDALTSAGSTAIGGRAFPLSAPERFLESADEKARELGFRRWKDVPKAEQQNIIRGDEALAKLDADRVKYYGRFGRSQTDVAFEQIDKSERAIEDTLLASWTAVQNGSIDRAEFRRRFTNMLGDHAYLSNRLLDASDDDFAGRPDETKQDYYARIYNSIQPETFDSDGDGFINEEEWQRWRTSRKDFWTQFPEAANYRSYITTDSKTARWKSPEMAQIVSERYTALDKYEQFLAVPKYKGLSVEEGAFVEGLRSLKNRVVTEARFSLAQRAGRELPPDFKIEDRKAWALTVQTLRQQGDLQVNSRTGELIKYAILLDKEDVRRRLINPERARYLQGNLDMVEWYPGALSDAGLSNEETAALGITDRPLGTSSQEQLASLAQLVA